jgi:hypothetical protein
MESGNKAISLVDLVRPYQEEVNQLMIEINKRIALEKMLDDINSEEDTKDGE